MKSTAAAQRARSLSRRRARPAKGGQKGQAMTTRYYLVNYTREIRYSKLFGHHRMDYVNLYPGCADDSADGVPIAVYEDEASAANALKASDVTIDDENDSYLWVNEYVVEEYELTDDDLEDLEDCDPDCPEFFGDFAGTCAYCEWPEVLRIRDYAYLWSQKEHCYLYDDRDLCYVVLNTPDGDWRKVTDAQEEENNFECASVTLHELYFHEGIEDPCLAVLERTPAYPGYEYELVELVPYSNFGRLCYYETLR